MSNLNYARRLVVSMTLMLAAAMTTSAQSDRTTLSSSYDETREQGRLIANSPVKTKDRGRKSGLIRQTTDLTCGPAALASLLKFYFGEETSEDEIARLSGTYEKRTSTLLGLRNASRAKGYVAIGYRMSFSQLMREVETSGVPVLVHFSEPSLHYALVLGSVDDFVLVSDPSSGNVSMHVSDFTRRWDNNALVVRSARSIDSARVEQRKKSAATRLRTLNRAASLPSAPGF